MEKNEVKPKTMKSTQEDVKCIICDNPILPGEDYYFLKPYGKKMEFFHASCWKEVQKKK